MRTSIKYPIHPQETPALKNSLLHLSKEYKHFCYLDSNFHSNKYGDYECIAAIGSLGELIVEGSAFDQLKSFHQSKKDWLFGYFSYDLKNELEALSSNNHDGIKAPLLHFFCPKIILILKKDELEILYEKDSSSIVEIEDLYSKIKLGALTGETNKTFPSIQVKSRISKNEYIETITQIKRHIQLGDIYEMNFCQEFFAEQVEVDPLSTYHSLNQLSPMPFSCFYKKGEHYLMCASPERFIKKKGSKIISQPIKGTIKRSDNPIEDEKLKKQLQNDIKERSENVMIVDLVRNDLSRTAKKGSVKVEELFGIYSFKNIHQMISTISSDVETSMSFVDIIKNAFPMGSMTGAPKIKAMELIEEFESTKRGIYSGSFGYITPTGDFDFNVVIRSILYNEINHYLSFMVGSAITSLSEAEREYDECLLKAKAMLEVLKH